MAQRKTGTKSLVKVRLKEPNMYKVIMHNDDFTTMEFVVEVLQIVFFKSPDEAESLMMKVHCSGAAEVGIYSYDVATSKSEKAMNMARAQGFPLRLTCEQA